MLSIVRSFLNSYIFRRLLQIIPLVLGVILICFLLIHLAPGSPVYALCGEMGTDPEYIEMMTKRFGLDKPLHEQLLLYLKEVLSGNLGYSFFFRAPVITLIIERIPATMLLMFTALIFSSVAGIVLGVIASKKPRSLTDFSLTAISLFGYSAPVFWVGQVLLLIFALKLMWLPIGGMHTLKFEYTGVSYWIDLLRHLTLPAFVLSIYYFALNIRLTRASMLEELGQDYIVMARSKGLDENTVVFKHALRNALRPIITVIGMNLGMMLAGAAMVEMVFSWPGLGRLLYTGISTRDYPVLTGMFIFISILVGLSNLMVDIMYAFIDPRIRYK